ncbi:MAG: hypothetical protein OXI67_04235 [Candidatus Poribacteria bacterium]|nr:hypothetical protein [Candidatus Poribacteria bacterium]
MTKKHLFFAVVFFLVFGGCYFLFYHASPLQQAKKAEKSEKVVGQSGYTVESLRKKYPHLQPRPQAWFEQQLKKPTRTWAEWVDTNVELALEQLIDSRWNDGDPLPWVLEAYDTPEKWAADESDYREAFEASAARYQEQGAEVPPTAQVFPKDPPKTQAELDNPHHLDIYEGPQEIESIMTEFDHRYSRTFSGERAEEIEVAYPKEAWIQAFLDKGGSFRDIYDYEKYMNSRAVLLNRSKDPSVWTSEIGGVRPASTLEAYTDAFIEREIWIQETWKHALRENPDMTGIAIEGEHYLPMRKNLTYVHNDGNGGITSWGGMLSREDHQNLLRGIEPEGMEIVYIDENYNITSKPSPWDPNSRDANKLVEKDLEVRMPEEFQRNREGQNVEEPEEFVRASSDGNPTDPSAARREAAREAAAREIAKAEFERFQDSMRQREEFRTMADREVARELAKHFSQQFLSKRSLKQGNAKGLENALEIMFQHGFEEGFRRVRRDSPSIADELERYFAETQRPPERQGPPQRPAPSKPPETAPPGPEAP